MSIQAEMLDVEEAAKIANLTINHVRDLLRQGRIKATKAGRQWRIAKTDLDDFLGIKTDLKSFKREIYIKELESKVKHYEFVFNTLKSNLSNIETVLSDI